MTATGEELPVQEAEPTVREVEPVLDIPRPSYFILLIPDVGGLSFDQYEDEIQAIEVFQKIIAKRAYGDYVGEVLFFKGWNIPFMAPEVRVSLQMPEGRGQSMTVHKSTAIPDGLMPVRHAPPGEEPETPPEGEDDDA